jgi:hypothetical protein
MPTPLDKWIEKPGPIRNLSLDLALDIAEKLTSPEDIVNFALACPGFLAYWLQLTEVIEQRRPRVEDPESDPIALLPSMTAGPRLYDPARVIVFQAFSERIMKKLFSPQVQVNISTILFMPNPSNRIYDIDFRRQHPEVGDPSPFPLLFQHRRERFQKYYVALEYRELLFTFKNLNRISPLCTAIHNFATDFAKKALSSHASCAHHSPPSFAHESLRNLQIPNPTPTLAAEWAQAARCKDSSPFQHLDMLHETERERLMLAFYQYEALCVTSAKITGYWEIRRALQHDVRAPNPSMADWNDQRARQSPLFAQSACQIERVVTVYQYVRLQYLLILYALWVEYRELLDHYRREATKAGYNGGISSWGVLAPPAIFEDRPSLLEWIDVLCSRGLLFLSEVLTMNADRRRDFIVRTYHPTRAKTMTSGVLEEEQYLIMGIFQSLNSNRQTFSDDLNYSDSLQDAAGPNLAYVRFISQQNTGGGPMIRNVDFCDEENNGLRRRGYVFWNDERCIHLGLTSSAVMDNWKLGPAENPVSFFGAANWLDSPGRLDEGQPELELFDPVLQFPDIAWRQALAPYRTPKTPMVVDFGILGDTWRIGEEASGLGEPFMPNYNNM